ncbi:zf-HC2 domain-containing protein [Acidobacteria bacterium AB60]|nr:zf-HC2 domain-containing protein [Acidobacteria bacterium AB60]
MTHMEALQTFAAERYLLNELSGRERDEFEEHFFECQECALDVRAGAAFVTQAGTELQSSTQAAPEPKRRPFFSFFTLPLAGVLVAAMAALLIYQNVVTLPRLRGEIATAEAPAAITATPLMGAATRGEDVPTVSATAGHPLYLNVDVPTDDRYAGYTLQVSGADGSHVASINISPEQAKNTLLVRIPAAEHSGGIYTLAIEGLQEAGMPGVQIAQYRFRVLNAN